MFPVTTQVFIDQISFTLDIPHDNRQSLKRRVISACKKGGLRRIDRIKNKSGYRNNYKIKLKDGNSQPIIAFGPVKDGCRFCRISFNPSKIDVSLLRKRLRFLLGVDFYQIYDSCSVTRIDTTVDIYGLSINNMFFYAKSFATSRGHGFGQIEDEVLPSTYISNTTKHGRRTGVTFGDPSSATVINIYDKNAKENRLRFPNKSGAEEQHWVRIEIRNRKTKRSISELPNLPNVFSKIEAYDSKIEKEKLNPLFMLACQNGSLNDSLACMERKEKDRHLYAIKKHSVSWFNAANIWEGLPDALRVLDFLKP